MSIRSCGRPANSFIWISVGIDTKRTATEPSGFTSARVLLIEVERLRDEHVDGRFPMVLGPEIEHRHCLVANPSGAFGLIGEVCGRDRHKGFVSDPRECSEGRQYVFRSRMQDKVYVPSEAKVSVRVDRQAAGHQIAHSRSVE